MRYLGLLLLKQPELAGKWKLSEDEVAFLIGRYREPEPRNAIAIPLRNLASAAIDVSDGLVGDVGKLVAVSHVGAVIEAALVPLSPSARKAVESDPKLLEALLTGGDDYEIVASVPEASASSFEAEIRTKDEIVTQIGHIEERDGTRVLSEGGRTVKLSLGIRPFLVGLSGPAWAGSHYSACLLRPACIFGIFRARLAPPLSGGSRAGGHDPVSRR